MAQVYEIIILAGNTADSTLTLNDNGLTTVTDVKDGDWIDWRIASGAPNVAKITGIYVDPNSSNIFSSGPSQASDDGTWWHGEVEFNGQPGTIESYTIAWQDTNGNGHTYDPKIVINS